MEGAECCGDKEDCHHPKPTLCVAQLQFEEFKQGGWAFHHSSYPMFSAKQLDQISDTVGTMGMPEVFYGFNHLYISNAAKDVLLEFSPSHALSLAAFAKQDLMLRGASAAGDEDKELNMVEMKPRLIEVKEASLWKKKDMSKVRDFKHLEVISDWTYSTPYKGSLFRLSKHARRLKLETALDLACAPGEAPLRVEVAPEAEIPLARLGRDNPILHFGELYLYEDDLGDQGYCCCSLRFRVMADCFYVLHRYYLRVDQVLVRVFDTRVFHAFGEDALVREFQHRESTYAELREEGFALGSEWLLSKTQADEVFPRLKPQLRVVDRLVIGQ